MKKFLQILSVITVIAIITGVFASCSNPFKSEEPVPDTVTLKTDLDDPTFTFTYGELKTVLPLDKLANLFENYEEKNADTEITLSHNEIVTRFSADVMKDDGAALEGIWSLATKEELAATTENKDKVLDYFNTLVNNLKKQKPAAEFGEDIWTDDSSDSIIFSRNGVQIDSGTDEYKSLRAAAITYKNYVLDAANDWLLGKKNSPRASKPTKGGESLDKILYLWDEDVVSKLTSEDVTSAISSVTSETTTANGKEYTTALTRTVVIKLKPEESSVLKAFSLYEKAPVLDELKKSSEYFTVDDYSLSFGECVITAVINAATDEIINLTYDNNMTVNTEITGMGNFTSLGALGVQFNCTDRAEYHFGWPSEEG